MLHKSDLREVVYEDLESLLLNCVPESHTLDFKRDFPFDRDGRLSLAADVVAFANTRGGDLVIGAEEAEGVITRFVPVTFDDRDAALRSLQSAMVDLIEPKIPGLHLAAVASPEGGHVVIVRTPPSFQAPHRVKKTGVFYTRTSTGIDPMDITTLRSTFLQNATAIESAKAFRENRLASVRDTPIRARMSPYALGVLHVVPVASILGNVSLGIDDLYEVARLMPPPDGLQFGARVNFDGVMSAYDSPDETFSYTQLFRNGALESVMPLQGDEHDVVWVERLLNALVHDGHHIKLTESLVRLGLDGPTFVMLSFIGIGGALLELPGRASSYMMGGPATVPKRYTNLMVPELLVESFASASTDIYPPLFDFVWNAAGRRSGPRSPGG
ncbi:helix-turn-helix domain-containing protein [Burkholderia gladioli]|uniref:Divergent AAA domain protein n=1 Tax=Burkholderia gladioli (strain BSR3) TaxID=999541 RepID=F2LAT5_BURGS|nr:ATP-binding protein [Burkholderia gladioli]AEA59585.1 divergent AAA domain protein [Burkholderia gladioli BSR3]